MAEHMDSEDSEINEVFRTLGIADWSRRAQIASADPAVRASDYDELPAGTMFLTRTSTRSKPNH